MLKKKNLMVVFIGTAKTLDKPQYPFVIWGKKKELFQNQQQKDMLAIQSIYEKTPVPDGELLMAFLLRMRMRMR